MSSFQYSSICDFFSKLPHDEHSGYDIVACLCKLAEQGFNILTADNPKIFNDELLWSYRHQFHNFAHKDLHHYSCFSSREKLALVGRIRRYYYILSKTLQIDFDTNYNGNEWVYSIDPDIPRVVFTKQFIVAFHKAKSFDSQVTIMLYFFIVFFRTMGTVLGNTLYGDGYHMLPLLQRLQVASTTPLKTPDAENEICGGFFEVVFDARGDRFLLQLQDSHGVERFINPSVVAELVAEFLASSIPSLGALPLIDRHDLVTLERIRKLDGIKFAFSTSRPPLPLFICPQSLTLELRGLKVIEASFDDEEQSCLIPAYGQHSPLCTTWHCTKNMERAVMKGGLERWKDGPMERRTDGTMVRLAFDP